MYNKSMKKDKFIGRESELNTLNNLYKEEGFSLSIIYGRRRVGKSRLIKEFVKDKECIYYTCEKVGFFNNLELFKSEVLKVLSPKLISVEFKNLGGLLDFIGENIAKKKLIIVIDELPYWAKDDEGMLSILQKYIDNKWNDKNIMLILCGSSLSFMEEKILSEKSPLFGRRNCQIRLNALDYLDSSKFVSNYSLEDKAIVYGVTGGIPKYLEFFDDKKSLDDNIKELFFNKNGYLYDETRNFLIQEFNEVELVNNVIEQIANDENTLNDISSKAHASNEATSYVLNKLMNVDLIEKRKCITEENNKKKTIYVLKDTMFKFWYKFIPKAISTIEIGNGYTYYEKAVKPNMHAYMGSIFENMCQYYILRNSNSKIDSFITQTGNWWGTRIIRKNNERIIEPTDIDVVGISSIDNKAIIGECKFKNEVLDKDVYDNLFEKDKLIKDYKIINHVFFSLSGYSKWVKDNKADDVLLLTISDLYK